MPTASELIIGAGVVGVLATLATATRACAADCGFKLSPDFVRHVLQPEAAAKLGPNLANWDVTHPSVLVEGDTVKLLVDPVAKNLLDPPYYVVFVEDCGRGTARSGFQAWDVALRLRSATPQERAKPGYVE